MAESPFQVLQPGVGYGLVIGLGCGFAIVMVALTLIQNRYGTHHTFRSAEEFNAASRSIKPGMIAAGIVSSWTHASTLLTSCTLAYLYGVSGGLWYGAFGTFQTLLFAVTAFKIKEKSNNAHTFPGLSASLMRTECTSSCTVRNCAAEAWKTCPQGLYLLRYIYELDQWISSPRRRMWRLERAHWHGHLGILLDLGRGCHRSATS